MAAQHHDPPGRIGEDRGGAVAPHRSFAGIEGGIRLAGEGESPLGGIDGARLAELERPGDSRQHQNREQRSAQLEKLTVHRRSIAPAGLGGESPLCGVRCASCQVYRAHRPLHPGRDMQALPKPRKPSKLS